MYLNEKFYDETIENRIKMLNPYLENIVIELNLSISIFIAIIFVCVQL